MAISEKFHVNPAHAVLLVDLGLEPADVLRAAELPGDLLLRKKISLTPLEYYRFWQAAVDLAPVENAPLVIAQSISVEAFDPVLFAALSSPNLLTALKRMSEFKALVGPVVLDITRPGDVLQMTVEFLPPSVKPPQCLLLMELVFFTHLARTGTRHRVAPIEARLPELPENPQPYEEYLGTPLTAGSPAIVFSDEDAERPFVTSNPGMWEFFEPELRKRVADLQEEASVAERVRAALHELLPTGGGSIDDVARKLGTSKRTLQRRLKGENTSFQGELDATREKLAKHYLGHSRMSGAEIAFLLGFEDPNSFTRAFHNWTGSTPETMRQRLLLN